MKFSVNTRICNELLSGYYQNIEDFQKLTSKDFLQIEYFIKPISGKEWLFSKIKYDKQNRIDKEDRFNQAGQLVDSSKYQFLENSVIRKSKEEKSIWKFNEDKILVEEIHEYDFDQPDIYKFNLNEENTLIDINNEIELIWKEDEPIELINPSNSNIIKKVIQKTELESKILQIRANEISLFRYDKYGRLIEIKSENRSKNFSYFGYDMMTGSEVKTIVENKTTYKAYKEEKLIRDKVVESITKYFEDGINLSRTVREVKTMK